MIDHESRKGFGVSRFRPLGRDRFWNRYWWFDGGLGAYPFSIVTQGIDLVIRQGTKAPNEGVLLSWASGLIIVEDFGMNEESVDEAYKIQVMKGEAVGKWGYYSETTEFDQLQQWLDNRGLRELALQNNMDRVSDLIVGGMEQRDEDLQTETQMDLDNDSKDSKQQNVPLYLRYTNQWA